MGFAPGAINRGGRARSIRGQTGAGSDTSHTKYTGPLRFPNPPDAKVGGVRKVSKSLRLATLAGKFANQNTDEFDAIMSSDQDAVPEAQTATGSIATPSEPAGQDPIMGQSQGQLKLNFE
jgi:hypothetical protein